jgi:hypothetical protein
MAFWLSVACGYLMLLAAGLFAGHLLACWRDGRGGGGTGRPAPAGPSGPSYALDVPPLGSAFDRALLPGVFDGEPLSERV